MSDRTNAPWKDEEQLRQKYYEKDLTISEIADLWDTTYDTIRYYKDKFEIPNKSVWDDLDVDEVRALYWDENMSLENIGDYYNCSGSNILKFMRHNDIPRRTPDHKKGGEWQDKDTLQRLYCDEDMTLEEIGEQLGCCATTVGRWMEEHGIQRDKIPEEKPPSYRTKKSGHETVRSKHNGKHSTVGVHQLVAIANGANPYELFVCGYNVHHKNNIPWDNRPENLEVMSKSEHHKHHYKDRKTNSKGEFIG